MDPESRLFRSNGKLLLTGEYLILNGAKALALPTQLGAELKLSDMPGEDDRVFKWKTFVKEECIFQGTFDLKANLIDCNDRAIGSMLENILKAMSELANENIFSALGGYSFHSTLEFPMKYGLGSSSTLIVNLAQWGGINAFELLEKTFGGSGYDIACASASGPLLYEINGHLPVWKEVDFFPSFHERMHFVYLNKKITSREAIATFSKRIQEVHGDVINRISDISDQVLLSADAENLIALLKEHELIISEALHIETIAKAIFPDFEGFIKSLGAWGGDFALVVGEKDELNYFMSKGFKTIIPFDKMIKHRAKN